jgi:hypothetical protein
MPQEGQIFRSMPNQSMAVRARSALRSGAVVPSVMHYSEPVMA